MNASELTYPVITLSNRGSGFYHVSRTQAKLETALFFQSIKGAEGIVGQIVVDSQSVAYEIVDARRVGFAAIDWLGWVPMPSIRLSISLQSIGVMKLEELKDKVFSTFRWKQVLDSAIGWDSIKEHAEKSSTFVEFFETLAHPPNLGSS